MSYTAIIQYFDLSICDTETTTIIAGQQTSMSTSTTTTTTTTTATTSTSFVSNTVVFIPPYCPNNTIGSLCNIPSDPCVLQQPCFNSGTCHVNYTIPIGYTCACIASFSGINCEFDNRVCRPGFSCLNGGICNGSTCGCPAGKTGTHCEYEANICGSIKCQNNGQCRSTYGNWSCRCVNPNLYSGTYCEIKSSSLRLREIVSRSLACVAIGCISTIVGFVLIMDALKYIFHIDPIDDNLRSSKKKNSDPEQNKKKKKLNRTAHPAVALRLQYVQ